MQEESLGIVLNYVTLSKYKIALLDKKLGRIEGIISGIDVCVGTLISYSVNKKNECFFISNKKIEFLPLELARTDMLFLHHVLEIVYYFAPSGSSVDGIYELFEYLYSVEYVWMSMQFKKFFLLKLLTTLGIVPELDYAYTSYINQLCQLDIDQFNIALINYAGEKELDRWLWCCVNQHSYVKEFKTTRFLSENRLI